MDELELDCAKAELIGNVCYFYNNRGRTNVLVNFIGVGDDINLVRSCMYSKTIDEVIDIIIKLSKQDKWSNYYADSIIKCIIKTMNEINKIKDRINGKQTNMEKDIAVIKDNVQNTADVVNLFTDVDKNRTNINEEIKKVNNRLDKLENSINQLVNMLQKS